MKIITNKHCIHFYNKTSADAKNNADGTLEKLKCYNVKGPEIRAFQFLFTKLYFPFWIDTVLAQHFLNANQLIVLSHTVGTTGRTGFNLSAIQCHC